jgi:hypothetical protein
MKPPGSAGPTGIRSKGEPPKGRICLRPGAIGLGTGTARPPRELHLHSYSWRKHGALPQHNAERFTRAQLQHRAVRRAVSPEQPTRNRPGSYSTAPCTNNRGVKKALRRALGHEGTAQHTHSTAPYAHSQGATTALCRVQGHDSNTQGAHSPNTTATLRHESSFYRAPQSS